MTDFDSAVAVLMEIFATCGDKFPQKLWDDFHKFLHEYEMYKCGGYDYAF